MKHALSLLLAPLAAQPAAAAKPNVGYLLARKQSWGGRALPRHPYDIR